MQLAATPAETRLVKLVATSLAHADRSASKRDQLLGAKADFVKAAATLATYDPKVIRIGPIEGAMAQAADGAAKLILGGAKESLPYNDAWIALGFLDQAVVTFGDESLHGSHITKAVESARTYLNALAG